METLWNVPSPVADRDADQLDGFAFALQQDAATSETDAKTRSASFSQGNGVKTLRLSGNLPALSWCPLGTQVLSRLGNGTGVRISIDISANVDPQQSERLRGDLLQILEEIGLSDSLHLES